MTGFQSKKVSERVSRYRHLQRSRNDPEGHEKFVIKFSRRGKNFNLKLLVSSFWQIPFFTRLRQRDPRSKGLVFQEIFRVDW